VQEYGSGGLSRYFCPRVWMENKPPPVGQQPLSLTQFLLGEVCQQLTDQTRPAQLLERFFVDAAKYIRLHHELFGNYGPGGLMLQVLCKCGLVLTNGSSHASGSVQVESCFNQGLMLRVLCKCCLVLTNSYGLFPSRMPAPDPIGNMLFPMLAAEWLHNK
jgi:hypothetical protein